MDPISDMFAKIRNGYAVKKETVFIPFSKVKSEIAAVLAKENFIKEVVKRGKKKRKNLELTLLYEKGAPAVRKIERISKPSKRVYARAKDIFPSRDKYSVKIFSTPKGILADREAKKEKVGGEVVAEIW